MSPALPITTSKKIVKALRKAGFLLEHVHGSHYVFAHPERPKQGVVIPMHGKDLKRGTLASILKQANMTVEELIKIL